MSVGYLRWLGWSVGFVWLGWFVGFRLWLMWFVCLCLGWWDGAVKISGSAWFGYGVVLVVTFVVGLLAFCVWVLSKVF
ncbi:hypothetical protein E0H75_10840 [Kribbella capetownensis]|uniref:Uncharacterized protein n=1 Tax=Kribbella capetownensis TaxID=1572659 RepID=A0A4V2M898_9ACTN|nr:hypothetical protein [Kribbella capetownensis]TCC50682.1 hypothetical protein E0H75_10840 [Kribbella capetownensis]